MVRVSTKPLFGALRVARQRHTASEFKQCYSARTGIEGTLSQAIRIADLRRSRYINLAKTHLQHVLIVAAINLNLVAG